MGMRIRPSVKTGEWYEVAACVCVYESSVNLQNDKMLSSLAQLDWWNVCSCAARNVAFVLRKIFRFGKFKQMCL